MPRPKKVVPAPTVDATIPPPPAPPAPPSAAVLKLQEQVVALVEKRSQAREQLSAQHAIYLAAQAQFQAAESAMKDVEADVQYRIGLIAQLENRAAPNVVSFPQPMPQMPSLAGISSSPSPQPQINQNQRFAMADAGDLRRELTGAM